MNTCYLSLLKAEIQYYLLVMIFYVCVLEMTSIISGLTVFRFLSACKCDLCPAVNNLIDL
jgi:hypothetical protein